MRLISVINNPMGKLYTICEWTVKLVYVNLLWLLFTLAGFIILGWMPATASLFTIVRKWLFQKETNIPIWSTFVNGYKNDFIKINISGFIFLIVGGLLYLDYHFVLQTEGVIRMVMTSLLLLLTFFYLITVIFFFPVFVHFNLKLLDYFKFTLLLATMNIHILLLILIMIVVDIFLLLYFPGLIPFFSMVSIACIIMAGGSYIFERMKKKQNALALNR